MRIMHYSLALILGVGILAARGHGTSAVHEHSTPTAVTDGQVIGHGPARYQVELDWAKGDPAVAPVINSHAIAESRDGLLYVVTDHPQNAFVVFRKDGTFVRAFGAGLEGGHGLEFFEKDGEEYLIHVDCGWHFAAEGWNATEWRSVADTIARSCAWSRPNLPVAGDPGPFHGTPALAD